eukprot:m51a1_g899 hypothetical protein (451) ;mRNA; f:42173-43989
MRSRGRQCTLWASGALGSLSVAVVIFLASGTASTIITKFIFTSRAAGRHGREHEFLKPWFNAWTMFFGMALCLIVHLVEARRNASRRSPKHKDRHPPVGRRALWRQRVRLVLVVGVPAMCDVVGTYLMNVGFLWITTSVWQMLRGSVIVFTAVLKVTYRHKRIYPAGTAPPARGNKRTRLHSEILGTVVVLVGVSLVGLSAFYTPGEASGGGGDDVGSSASSGAGGGGGGHGVGVTKMVAGIALVVLSELMIAIQTIVEEKLLHDVRASATLLVGIQGVWGLVVCSLVCMPLAQVLPGDDGDGIREDTLDTLEMLGNSWALVALNAAFALNVLVLNVYILVVIAKADAMLMNLLDPVRTLFVWGVMLLVHYAISPAHGESLNWWSFLELGGFAVLVLGLFLYNGVVRFRCLPLGKNEAASPRPSTAARGEEDEGSGEREPLVPDASLKQL